MKRKPKERANLRFALHSGPKACWKVTHVSCETNKSFVFVVVDAAGLFLTAEAEALRWVQRQGRFADPSACSLLLQPAVHVVPAAENQDPSPEVSRFRFPDWLNLTSVTTTCWSACRCLSELRFMEPRSADFLRL